MELTPQQKRLFEGYCALDTIEEMVKNLQDELKKGDLYSKTDQECAAEAWIIFRLFRSISKTIDDTTPDLNTALRHQ